MCSQVKEARAPASFAETVHLPHRKDTFVKDGDASMILLTSEGILTPTLDPPPQDRLCDISDRSRNQAAREEPRASLYRREEGDDVEDFGEKFGRDAVEHRGGIERWSRGFSVDILVCSAYSRCPSRGSGRT
jgi:hypothetical protein